MILLIAIETNGLYNCSLLGFKWKLVDQHTLKQIESGERYYFPQEPYNMEAIKNNGLTEEKITSLRQGQDYSAHFDDDSKYINELLNKADLIVTFNTEFLSRFISHNTPAYGLQFRYQTLFELAIENSIDPSKYSKVELYHELIKQTFERFTKYLSRILKKIKKSQQTSEVIEDDIEQYKHLREMKMQIETMHNTFPKYLLHEDEI